MKKIASNIDKTSLDKIVNVDSSESIFNKNGEIVLDELRYNKDAVHSDKSLSKSMDITDNIEGERQANFCKTDY